MPLTGEAAPLAVSDGSLKELSRRNWDVVVVGAGHNGLACAAYLARAGKKVLVLEAREIAGGACTLRETWPGYRVSPCAYLAGLLHPRVIAELELPRRGFRWMPAHQGLFVPFEDGRYIQLYEDDERCLAEVKRFAPDDLEGYRAMGDVMTRLREALRPEGDDDLWLYAPPSREVLENRLGEDDEALNLLLRWSMFEYVDRYLQDEALRDAHLGQGVIGSRSSPFEPGTASINFHHSSGRMGGGPGTWGFVQGGMGLVSKYLADAAREAGASIVLGTPVPRIIPGKGVELAGGDVIHAPVVVSNADPRTTLDLLGDAADSNWRERVSAIPMTGAVLKMTLALKEPPRFKARMGMDDSHLRGQMNTPLTAEQWRRGHARMEQGDLPEKLWCEMYLQSMSDPSIAPEGRHLMSIFAQYVPYEFARGDWNSRQNEAARLARDAVGSLCLDFDDSIEASEIMGPPDIEREIGLHGGHIFQGEILPDYMWDRRLEYETPMEGVYLCGAGTYPGGSVMAVNGRNAALRILNRLPEAR